MKPKPHISIIIPVYGCSECLPELVNRLDHSLSNINENWEIIMVNDASPDYAWEIITEITLSESRIKGINLSRNFGQHYAITAGLDHCSGDWIVIMDCDLQDQPEEILKLYEKAKEGYDIVYAQRVNRKDGFFKRLSSEWFYAIFSYLTDTKQDSSVANFGIYHRKVIKAILSMKDHVRYFPTMSQWVGFRRTSIPVTHSNRKEGKSSYSLKMLFEIALENILAYSDKPLRLTVKIGLLISLLSGMVGFYYFIQYLTGRVEVAGYTSLILSIWFLSGVIIFIIGLVGIYLGKTFQKVKNRPLYIIQEKVNIDEVRKIRLGH